MTRRIRGDQQGRVSVVNSADLGSRFAVGGSPPEWEGKQAHSRGCRGSQVAEQEGEGDLPG